MGHGVDAGEEHHRLVRNPGLAPGVGSRVARYCCFPGLKPGVRFPGGVFIDFPYREVDAKIDGGLRLAPSAERPEEQLPAEPRSWTRARPMRPGIETMSRRSND